MTNLVIKTVADLDSFKAAAHTEYVVFGWIGACPVRASYHKRNGKACITFKLNRRRASYAELVELIGYL